MATKVEYVTSLVHKREELVRERELLVADLDRQIAKIDDEIERAWQGSTANGRVVAAAEDTAPARGNVNKILAELARSSTLDYGELAEELYGEDNPTTRKRLRSSLQYLQAQGRVRNLGPNQWEVVSE